MCIRDRSTAARRFNAPILDHILENEDYPTLKAVCEGRELPAYEAASEFAAQTANELDGLLSGLGGEKGAVNTLEKLEAAEEKAEEMCIRDSLNICWSRPAGGCWFGGGEDGAISQKTCKLIGSPHPRLV